MKQDQGWMSEVITYIGFRAGESDGGGEGGNCQCKEESLHWHLVPGHPTGIS